MSTKNRKLKCPHCGSERIWSKGFVPTRHGPKRRFQCYKCGTSFYPERKKSK